MNEELRMFSFTNCILSSIQQGIQPGHAWVELFVKYRADDDQPMQVDTLYEWATIHKTVICKNGGAHEDIEGINEMFKSDENLFPWAPFFEDRAALNSCITSVAIVLPARIFEVAVGWVKAATKGEMKIVSDEDSAGVHFMYLTKHGGGFVGTLTEFEYDLAMLLAATQLAR